MNYRNACMECAWADKKDIIRKCKPCIEIKCINPASKYYNQEYIIDDASTVILCSKYKRDSSNNDIQPRINHIGKSNVVSNDRDKFINILNGSNSETFEEILTEYIHKFGDSITADACYQISRLLLDIQYEKIAKLGNVKRVAKEHAIYLKSYLEGTMYNDENALEKYREVQKNNAQTIIDACND